MAFRGEKSPPRRTSPAPGSRIGLCGTLVCADGFPPIEQQAKGERVDTADALETGELDAADRALIDLLGWLDDQGYDFVTPTPATHARLLRQPHRGPGCDLRDILGWSRPFRPVDAFSIPVELLAAAGALSRQDGLAVSAIRVSRLKGRLFIHSAYPTCQQNAVFLGPDSYRFADFVSREIEDDFTGRVLDVGGGCGVGAMVVADQAVAADVLLSDINPLALRYARIGARHAGLRVQTLQADGLQGAPGDLDLIIANPPYMAGSRQTYRDGGDMHGGRLSLTWARGALMHLKPGGRLLLYTGSAIAAGGRDGLRKGLARLCAERGAALDYREIDPDVFGEELEREAYADIERIAAIGAKVTARPSAATMG